MGAAAANARTQLLEDRLGLAYVIGGLAYPGWWLLRPPGANDPLIVWVLVGAAFLATGIAALASKEFRATPFRFAPTFVATAHLHALFFQNLDQPYYATAALLVSVSSLLVLTDRAALVAYMVMNVALAARPLFLDFAPNVVFYFVGVLSVLFWVGHSVRTMRATQDRTDSALRATREELAHERSERQRLQHELETAQRMDSLGRLAGAFSHEFNNQLMAIRIHTDLLERSLPANAPQRADIDRIQETTTSAADLTARLLTFSRATRVREDPADVATVVKKSLVTLRHLMSEKVPVAINAPAESCVAPVGARQLSQVLLNIALNARDAMPEGGVLRVDVARLPRSAVKLPIDIPAKTLVVLTIADDGIGMNADVQHRLFEPFFTTKGERGNSGLGLSVVYGIVKETGGHIRVTSEQGAGARFDIFWPQIEATATARSEPAFPALEGAQPRTRVLLVEDQPALRDGLSRWLGDHGYRVVSCESGEEALARANEVDVIASDVVLRGMDGIELLARLRRSAPRLPAVLFSGHLDHLAKERREIPEGVRFLEKPFAPEALVTTLDALVEAARAESDGTLH